MKNFLQTLFLGIIVIWGNSVLHAQTNSCNNNAGGQLTVGASCTPTAMDCTNNTNYWDGAAGCGASDVDDVWAWFTATSTSTTITYQPAANRDAILTLFGGIACNPTMASLSCSNVGANGVAETIVWATVIGNNYRIRVERNGSNANMTGTICVFGAGGGGGSNDDCGGATPVTVNADRSCGSVTAGTVVGATASPDANGCFGTADDDVWFSFVATATTHYVDLVNVAGSTTDLYHSVYDATPGCGSLGAAIVCSDPNSSTLTGLTIGVTYLIRVYTWTSTTGQTTTFDVCVGTDPPPVTIVGCSGNFFDSGGAGADYGLNENITTAYCSGIVGQCVSMTFTNFSTESCCDHLTVYDGPNTSSPQIGVYNGTTLNGQTIQSTSGCLTFVWTSDGSVVNTGWSANVTCSACPTCSDGILNGQEVGIDCGGPTCLACPCASLPIFNDEACCATPLTVNLDQNCTAVTAGTVNNATPSFNGNTCFGTDDDDVWFSFIATSSEHNVSLLNVAGSVTDMYHAVYGGTCSNTGASLVCSDADNSSLSGLTIGNTYFIRVYTYTSTPGQNSTFDVCVTSPCAGLPEPTCGLNYNYSTTAYAPVNYTNGTVYTFTDDRFADSFTPIGFDFCFDGVTYQDCMVSSNGYLIFPGCYSQHGTNDVTPTGYSPYSINAAVPNLNDAPRNAIMGPWQDIDPSIAGSSIRTRVHGTAPNRVFVAKFNTVGMFSCTAMDFTGQIMLYETTNEIEVHIGEKTTCTTWNDGAAILGLHNHSGTVAVVPAGYNYPTQWSVPTNSPEGHRFVPNCPTGVCDILLPMELLSFEGTAKEVYNQLNWVTASETESDYFVVEKSTNGASFFELGKLPATGNSTTSIAYEYFDYQIDESIVYYRLRQVGLNGKVAYSKIIALNRGEAETTAVKIFPNPSATGLVSVAVVGGKDAIQEVTLSNYLGQRVPVNISSSNGREVKLNTVGMPKGTYVVEIKFKYGQSIFKKMILN